MSATQEGNYNLEGIVTELPGYMSRRDVLLAAGVLYQPLTVLGISNLATAGAVAAASNTGNGAMGAVTINPATAQLGAHTLTITGSGATAAFSVTRPDGTALAAGAVGSAYNQGGLSFTLADGAVDFVAGDTFTIHVPATVATLGTNVGNGTFGTITVAAGAKPGVYSLTIIEPGTNVGTFVVTDPDGDDIGHGAVATAFSAGGLGFTLADGATDFVAGDQFRITVGGASGTYGAVNLASVTGLDVAVAVLRERIDTRDAARTGNVLFRDADILADQLTWPTGFTAAQKAAGIAQLAQRGIRALAIPPTVGV